MGRTYRGLSKKDRENLKRNRLQRHKREIRDEEDINDRPTFNRKKNRDPKNNMGRNLSDDEYDYSDEE